MRVSLLAAVLSCCAGCFYGPLRIGPLNPRPNVLQVGPLEPRPNVAPQSAGVDKAVVAAFAPAADQALSLTLAAEVRDEFQIPRRNRIPDTNVQGWRASVTRGFRNAFGPEQPGGRAIVLDRVELAWAPVAVNNHGGVLAVNAQVTYRAKLVDEAGMTRGAVASTVESKASASDFDGIEPTVASALESMFEEISSRLLGQDGTGSRAPSKVTAPNPDP